MFSFHKPRVYRSSEGCCICRAKSSSSRFTDSRKYEDDSVKCFNLVDPRQGEICNACVLLVKRFKRLPTGSTRHWGHVVDARVGPGMKSMTKFKKLKDDMAQGDQQIAGDKLQKTNSTSSSIPEKFSKIFRKTKKSNDTEPNESEMSPGSWDEETLSVTPDSITKDLEDQLHISSQVRTKRIDRRKILKPKKNNSLQLQNFSFIDEKFWKILKICCGVAYENAQASAIIIDLQRFKPCSVHNISNAFKCELAPNKHNNEIKYTQNGNKNQTNVTTTPPVVIPTIHNTSISLVENSMPVLKKHHLFYKRQQENFPVGGITETKNTNEPIDIVSHKNSILHKIKSDTAGKVIKHSLNKINTTIRLKQQDLLDSKPIIKIIESPNPVNIKKLEINKMLNQSKKNTDPASSSGTKFSDNSSDSGFDENLLDRKSISPIENHIVDNKYIARPAQTMFLANGIQIHGQQQNLILTGNEVAAKISKSRRQQHI